MRKNTNIFGIIGSDWKRLFGFFLLLWLLINAAQAIFTEVMSDESYYFLYGENLAWGYFDHPPMVGLMAFISNLLFDGNLSVRFVTLLLQAFTLLLIWKTLADKSPDTSKVLLFFILSASMVMFQVYGFVTTPDAPFLFFAAFFLFSYKKFLQDETWFNTLFLALSLAGMVYSKYHAFLIIALILASNLRLLTKPKFWLAGLVALALLIPHFYWQVANDFPSFKYHLSDRSSSFRWNYFFEYLPNQLVVFNPFTFGALVYVFIKYKPQNVFERGLYFLIIGFISFFWIMSFRGHVEPHWTVICSIPMIILVFYRSLEDPKLMRYVKRWVALSLLLIVVARVLITTDLLPQKLDFSGKQKKNTAVGWVAGELPVVFTGSFQGASNYHFFTGQESFVLSAIDSRQTQFDILKKELNYQGKPVFISQYSSHSQEFVINGYTFYGYFANSFQSVNRLKIEYVLSETDVKQGDTITIPFVIHNPTSHAIDFNHPEFPVSWKAAYIKVNGRRKQIDYIDCCLTPSVSFLSANQTVEGSLTTVVPDLSPDEYQFTMTLLNSLCAAQNSEYMSLKINEK